MSASISRDSEPDHAAAAQRWRAFNRFYTQRIGVLHERLGGSGCSLTESRLLWELAHGEPPATATTLARRLGLDLGYVSRLLSGFRRRGWLQGERAAHDARQVDLRLTVAGRAAFAPIDEHAQLEAQALLDSVGSDATPALLGALDTVQTLLVSDVVPKVAPKVVANGPVTDQVRLRPHRSGDMGWVIARHAELYAREYGWDQRFEALVARIAADFIEQFDPAREACWIAERGAARAPERLGCVFLVQARDDATGAARPGVAQLRMLIVEPAARGLGLGRQLVGTCTAFAQAAGYREIVLWTNSVLGAARHLYEQAGYQLVASELHHSFGKDLVGETWSLSLPAARLVGQSGQRPD